MRPSIASILILGAALALGGAAYAQQPADATKATPPASATSSAAAPVAAPTTSSTSAASTPAAAAPAATTAANKTDAPSPDFLKKAHNEGYYTRVRKGATFFCKKEAQLGTRFQTENCMSQEQLAMVLERNQAQRDQMMTVTCGGGGSCGGGK